LTNVENASILKSDGIRARASPRNEKKISPDVTNDKVNDVIT
jgi:hypothetical protein